MRCTSSISTVFLSFCFLLLATRAIAQTTYQTLGQSFKYPFTTSSHYTSSVLFSNLTNPHGLTFDTYGNILVVERGVGITAFSPAPVVNPLGAWQRKVLVSNSALTGAIAHEDGKIYVTTNSQALIYLYDEDNVEVGGSFADSYPVVTGLPSAGEPIHTIRLEKASNGNVIALIIGTGPPTTWTSTSSSDYSQVRRFPFPSIVSLVFPPPAMTWSSGQILAKGVRNPTSFAFAPDDSAKLYILENSMGITGINGITSTFGNQNPADELNLVILPTPTSTGLLAPPTATITPKPFGHPDCVTLWDPQADPVGVPQYTASSRGAQMSVGSQTNSWCQNTNNNVPPVLYFEPHSLPADITFYEGVLEEDGPVNPFGDSYIGSAFVAMRGASSGFGVAVIGFPLSVPPPTGGWLPYEYILQAWDLDACPDECIGPGGVAFGRDGHLYVTSESTGELFVVERLWIF
ncbi:hypothetical protein BDN72DRAFT_893582 [Pluteus cervinus]|uniref:Uncharacterized protein n=1 Tax=Pluteus cervinus TaxID=181527 RepID=A0ACD3B899_9AGAR|nr:hypothetical protein BDN72DRAFT_893582 [Pluteus cervinus]